MWIKTHGDQPRWFNLDHAYYVRIHTWGSFTGPKEYEVVAEFGQGKVASLFKTDKYEKAVGWLLQHQIERD